MEMISVHAAPSEYILKAGALDLLESKLLERGIQKALIVTGRKSWDAVKRFWPDCTKVSFGRYTYNGECSFEEVEAIKNLVDENRYEAVIGVGGGKVLDLAKAACHEAKKQAILIPTLASNCAPWTPLSVLYDRTGRFIRYDIYPVCTSLLLVEPEILAEAPLDMLIAGIGDTLAKWYEADVQMAHIDPKPVPLQISHFTARKCRDLLLHYSDAAIKAAESGKVSDEFIQVVETIIMYGGMVGGFGDHYGRIAGAHSIHNGMTALEESHHLLHGEKVAYGILVQLVLEGRLDEVGRLLPFYRKIGLPASLKQMGIAITDEEKVHRAAAKAALPAESIHVMPGGPFTAEMIAGAFRLLEEYSSNHS